jgi:RHS repeat-associated protein
VTYAHSNTDELVSVTDSTGATVATYGYDALGARASLTRPNAASTSYAPDAARRLQQITHDLSGTGFDLTTTFAYNPAGQITSKTVSNDAAYTWTPPTSTTPAQFDGQNQLTSFAGTAVTDDANGNVWTGLGSLTYTYDALGQLRQASGGASPALVDYDPAGMLRRVQVGSTTTEYLYDGADLVAQYNGSGAVLRRFVHGASHDEPLVVYEGSGTSNKTWLHADERGSIIAASNASGVAATSVKYSADGDSGPLVSPFGYTGQLHLPELQLYYYKARMYSPKAGRFPQPDPIGYAGGMNLFGYVGNDPVNRTDPSGLCWDTQPFQYVNALSVLEDGTRGNPRPTAVRNPEYELYSCEWLYQWQMTGYVDFSQPSSDSTSPSPPPPLPLSCPPAARAEYRYGGFLAVSIRLGRVFMFDVDLDAGSSRRDILSGQRRITTGIKFGGELLGTGGEVEWFHRDIPLQPGDLAPGLLWREPYETVGDWRSPLEMDGSTERGIPLGGAKLGVGVGGLWSFDPLAPLCGNG